MLRKTSPHLLILCFSLIPFFLPCITSKGIEREEDGHNKIKGMFVFGSSLVDNGNNNFLLLSFAKADYSPYGIDFPLGPSGRFTNGKNVIDLLGDQLGIGSYIPAFNNPLTKGTRIVHGVDFASGGSGILDDTGFLSVGKVTSLNHQIRNFEEVTLPDLEQQLGLGSRESLPSYLFVVGSGGNDYSFNYFLRKCSTTSSNNSLEAFTANLITKLSGQLKKLYDLGARKFVLMSMNPNGSTPMAKAKAAKGGDSGGGLAQKSNQAARLFNSHLRSLVDSIKPQMPGSNLVYVSSYKVIREIIRNPTPQGFSDTSNPCCEVASIGILCKRGGSICANRTTHVFFDQLHPTEAVNVLIARNAYASNLKTLVYPINVKELAQI